MARDKCFSPFAKVSLGLANITEGSTTSIFPAKVKVGKSDHSSLVSWSGIPALNRMHVFSSKQVRKQRSTLMVQIWITSLAVRRSENQITGNTERVSLSLIPQYEQKGAPANLGFLHTTASTS